MKEKRYRGLDGRPVFDEEEFHLIWSTDGYSLSMTNIRQEEFRNSKIKSQVDAELALKELGIPDYTIIAIFEKKVGSVRDIIVQYSPVR